MEINIFTKENQNKSRNVCFIVFDYVFLQCEKLVYMSSKLFNYNIASALMLSKVGCKLALATLFNGFVDAFLIY
jgi:hypothetical protein